MKQQYKDLMIKFLENNPGLEVTSNPNGWWRQRQTVGETILNSRSSIDQSIAYGELESAIIALYVRDKIRSTYTSYKVVYDGDKKEFIGKLKRRDDNSKTVSVEIEVPENVWFDTVDLRININGKSSIVTSLTFNVRNGMFPKNIDEIRKQMEWDISKKVSEQLQGKGRVAKNIIRLNHLRYSKTLTANFVCSIITHDNEDLIIKL